jgi:Holliday junction resolvase-like predicted endonuclease
MLTENDVIKFVSLYLKNNGYNILETKNTTEKGIDIVADHPKKGKCFVEAKGETSSQKGSSKYGEPFDKSQIKTHIGAALLMSFQIKQKNENSNIFIALPYEKRHLEIIDSIRNCLIKTDIKVLFVKNDGSIEEKLID